MGTNFKWGELENVTYISWVTDTNFLVKNTAYSQLPYKWFSFSIGEIAPVYEEEKQGMEFFLLGSTKLKQRGYLDSLSGSVLLNESITHPSVVFSYNLGVNCDL